MAVTAMAKTGEQHRGKHQQVTWEGIQEAGTYVDVTTGDLFRIPQEALLKGSSPLIRKESLESSLFLKVSDSPYVTNIEARMVCAENNVQPNF